MVCQVAVTDGRIIMPTVKSTRGTLGHSLCRLLNVDFQRMSQSGGLYYFFLFIFCTNAFLVIYSLTIFCPAILLQWREHCSPYIYNDGINSVACYTLTHPLHHGSWNKRTVGSFLSFSLSHDASKHDMFACVIHALPEAKFIWLKSQVCLNSTYQHCDMI